MKIRRSVALKIALSSLLISLYSFGGILGLALMCLSAWQYAGYALNPNFYVLAYGPDIRLVLALLLTSSVLLIVLSVLGILTGLLFLFVQPRRWQLLLGLLATGLILGVTMEAIAVTVQVEQWEEQLPVVPAILENRTRYATFAPDDWVSVMRVCVTFLQTILCSSDSNCPGFRTHSDAAAITTETTIPTERGLTMLWQKQC